MPGAVERLASAIQEATRTHVTAAPPPRALPYLGLEHVSGTGFHLLDALSTRGIFRKYERVLDLGAGLGGTSRWLAARLGCEVVGTTASAEEAAAAADLTRRARLSAQVTLLPADPATLPFRAGQFTHVWILEAMPRFADTAAVLREAYRALRRGGTLAVQDLVLADPGGAPQAPAWQFVTPARRADELRRAGFVDIELRDRTADAPERSARVLAARERLHRMLPSSDPALGHLIRQREAIARSLRAGELRVVQMLAHRA